RRYQLEAVERDGFAAGGGVDRGSVGQQLARLLRGGVDPGGTVGGLDPPRVGGAQYGNGHEVGTFSRPIRRLTSNSLLWRRAVIIETASRRADFGLVPRKSLLAGGPHCARPDAVKGAQPGSTVSSNMSPSAKCSTRKPSGSRQ